MITQLIKDDFNVDGSQLYPEAVRQELATMSVIRPPPPVDPHSQGLLSDQPIYCMFRYLDFMSF